MPISREAPAAAGAGRVRPFVNGLLALVPAALLAACGGGSSQPPQDLAAQGRQIFRFDTGWSRGP